MIAFPAALSQIIDQTGRAVQNRGCDTGFPNAPLGVKDSIPGVVDAVASQDGKSGLQFLDHMGRQPGGDVQAIP